MKNNYNIGKWLILLVSQCLPFFMNGHAITFQKIYPTIVDQSGRDGIPSNDGGYIIIGMTENQIPGDTNIYIIKTNELGDTIWTKSYGGPQPEYPYSILETNDGNYFIVGYTASYGAGSYDTWLLKIDNYGSTLWSKTYGGTGDDQGKEIIATSDGNYLIVGRSNSPGNSYYDAFLTKIDPSGTMIWTKNYGGTQYETGNSVKQCLDGGFIFTGLTFSYGQGGGDIYLVKTNSAGETTWTKTYGGNAIEEGNGIVENSDESYIICAETNSSGAGDMDVQVIKTDEDGNIIWNKTYGGTQKDVSKTIYPTFDGGYIIGAISRSFGWINPDMWLIKLDTSGDTMWTKHYGGLGHDHCHSARQTLDGGLIAIGHNRSTGPKVKIMFLKLDQFGTLGTAVDLTPPTPTNYSPRDDMSYVAKNTNLTLTFNEAIQKGTGNILIKENGIITQTIPVWGTNVTASGNKVTINPASDFNDGSSVNIEMAAGVFIDISDNSYTGIANPATWNFKVVDLTSPTVISFNPPDDMTNVAKNTNLVITFSETVQKGTGNIIVKENEVITQTISVSGSNVNVSNNIVTINPINDFSSSTTINVEITEGAFKDFSNNSIVGTTTWNFKTANATVPVAISYIPADDTTNVEKNTNLVITFNETVQKGIGNIIIKEKGIVTQIIPVSGSNVTVLDSIVIIDPTTDFTDDASINVEMDAGVFKDMLNNNYTGISDATTWNFKIVDGLAPVINAYIPADDTFNVAKNTNLIITLNEPVQKGIGDIIIKEAGIVKQLISVRGTNVIVSNNIVSIDPPFDFNDNTSVNVEMGIGVFEDMANNKCAGINNAATWNFTITTDISVVENNFHKKFNIYPNPNNGNFIVDLPQLTNQEIEISTFNLLGQLIDKAAYRSPCKVNIELPDQEKGIYFIEIQDDQTRFREKIVFQ